jgi:hypothetical protein
MALHLELESSNGNLDLTGYLDVNEGAGLDPSDPTYTNHVISTSLLKQGGTLALENLKPRQLVFPLKLKASSKDKLTALVREINVLINTAGCEVEWQDEGASAATYFDVIAGQLDAEFAFRMGQQAQPWLKAKLVLSVQPLGQAEKGPRTLLMAGTSAGNGATLTATSPVMVFMAGSPVRGDAPALAQAVLNGSNTVHWTAFSLLPGTAYNPALPLASISAQVGAPSVALGATNNGWLRRFTRVTSSSPEFEWKLPAATMYAGMQRVLALVAGSENSSGALFLTVNGAPAASANFSGAEWPGTYKPIDLGPIALASGYLAENGLSLGLKYAGTSSYADLTGLVIIPDTSTVWERRGVDGSYRTTLDGPTNRVLDRVEGVQAGRSVDVTGLVRGQIPTVPVQAAPVFAFLRIGALLEQQVTAYVNVLERFRYVA